MRTLYAEFASLNAPWKITFLWLLFANGIAFLLFGLDKWKAKRNAYRIREQTLLLWALAGGSVGALLGMRLFRHKTRKPLFYIGVPLILLAQITVAWLCLRS